MTKIGVAEFLIFALYYLIMKAILLFINVETRRHDVHVPAAVSGLFS